MVCAWIWCLEDGRAGYRMPPWQLVGSVWRLGRPFEPVLPSRRLESAAGVRWYWCRPGLGEVAWRHGVIGRM